MHTASPCQAASELEKSKKGRLCHKQVMGRHEKLQAARKKDGVMPRRHTTVLVEVTGNW